VHQANPEIIRRGGADFFYLSFFLLSSQKLRGDSRGALVFFGSRVAEPP